MELHELRQSQALPLEMKIHKSLQRIREWYDHWRGQVYVSFSGGKDSTVLLNLVRSIYPDVLAVFCDTGLEYPEIRDFVSTMDNIEVIRPKTSFRDVIFNEGYPVISKKVAQYLHQYRTAKSASFKNKLLNGWERGDGSISRRFSIPYRWQYLINAPFKISDRCCNVMKKSPFKQLEKSGLMPMTGEMAEDSETRKRIYLLSGCNSFKYKRPKSKPLGFWLEHDILEYLRSKNVPYSSIYGDIVSHEGQLITTGAHRTGCMFCMFGIHMEKGENRFMRMQRTHPGLWKYCIYQLGIGKVLNYIGIPYSDIFEEKPSKDGAVKA